MNFDLSDLRAFVAVAKLGSFGAAAVELHISQPALSRRVGKLESALGAAKIYHEWCTPTFDAGNSERWPVNADDLAGYAELMIAIADFTPLTEVEPAE